MRASRLVPLVALVLSTSAVALAANAGWPDLLAKFRKGFVHKGEGSDLESRRKAIGILASSKDGRAVPELLEAAKRQEKHAARLRKEWEPEQQAFEEKDRRIVDSVNEKARRARENGQETYSVTPEEKAWVGDREDDGLRVQERKRVAALYTAVLDEEDLVGHVLRSCSRVISEVEGDEQGAALAALVGAARSAPPDRRPHFLKALGYARGDRATDVLEQFAADMNPEIVIVALEAIGRQNTERGMNLLIGKLTDPRWQVRAAAIEGLTFFRDVRVVDALLEGARKEEGVLQRNFFVAMARIVREKVPALLDAWDSFWKAHRAEYETKWKEWAFGEPVVEDPPVMQIESTTGSTSFYGVTTNSKHLIFVLDVSGSMALIHLKGPKPDKLPIDIAKKEIKNAIRSMAAAESGDERGDSSFNVVLFSSTTTVYRPGKMVKASKKEKEAAQAWVDETVKAEGATNIYAALEQAFNIVSATREAKNLKHGADTIYFMTDGKPTVGKTTDPEVILRDVKLWNQTRKITIHVIGVGPDTDPAFLGRLASENGGQYIAR